MRLNVSLWIWVCASAVGITPIAAISDASKLSWRIDHELQALVRACPLPTHLYPGELKVDVHYEPRRNVYRYTYTMKPAGTGMKFGMSYFSLPVPTGTVVDKWGTGWSSCYVGTDALICRPKLHGGRNPPLGSFAIESAHPPAPVIYRTLSVDPESTEEFRKREDRDVESALLPYFNHDTERVRQWMSAETGGECGDDPVHGVQFMSETSNTVYDPHVHGFHALTRGPAPVVTVEGRIGVRDAEHLQIRLLGKSASPQIKLSSLQVTNLLGRPLVLVEQASVPAESGSASDLVASLSLRPTDLPCNSKGVVIEGVLEDNRPFRAGVPIETPMCEPIRRQYTVELPPQ